MNKKQTETENCIVYRIVAPKREVQVLTSVPVNETLFENKIFFFLS